MKYNTTIFNMLIVIKRQWNDNLAQACLRPPFRILRTMLSVSGGRDLVLVFLLVKKGNMTFF